MSEDFKWNDELVLEFARFTNELSPIYQGRYSDLEDFKRAKQKAKQKLFTTEDGKDIYEGDKVALLSINNWLISSSITASSKPFYGDENQFKYFSTEAAAKDYIVFNKPCLSLNDLLSAWGDGDGKKKEYYANAPLFLSFKRLVNEKLNAINR